MSEVRRSTVGYPGGIRVGYRWGDSVFSAEGRYNWNSGYGSGSGDGYGYGYGYGYGDTQPKDKPAGDGR